MRTLPNLQAALFFQTFDERCSLQDILGSHHLGKTNAFDARDDNGFEVRLEPRGRKRIDTHVSPRAEILLRQGRGYHAPRIRLFRGQNAVFDVEKDCVSARRFRLLNEPVPIARNEHPGSKLLVSYVRHRRALDRVALAINNNKPHRRVNETFPDADATSRCRAASSQWAVDGGAQDSRGMSSVDSITR